MPKYFDVHTHTHFVAYDADREEVVKRALDAGVWMALVGTQADTSRNGIALAERYPEGVYATIGLHPIHTEKSHMDPKEMGGGTPFTSRGEFFDLSVYRPLAEHPKTVGIGECGLDYYRLGEETKDVQKKAFEAQIALANEVGKPLMVHVRNAYEDAYDMLKGLAKVQANIHFFAGTWDVAKKFLDLGCTLSFTGVVTFTHDYDETVKNAPLDRLMSETDAPYVSPVPYRGKRNEPLFIEKTVERIAEIRGEPLTRVREQLLENALAFFGLKTANKG